MTDYQKSKLPFNIVSSSVNTTYMTEISSGFKPGVDIVGHHQDTYAGLENEPLQTTFTRTHVGGNQHRHVPLNSGTDNDFNRPEAFKIKPESSTLKIYGPDYEDVNKPRAQSWNGAKSPINITNIETSGNIAGNFEKNYQVVQSVGRRTTNNLIVDGFIASGNLTTQFITGANNHALPDITNNSKSIFVERFNAPGGKQESSRGALDRAGEELSPNNSLTTRNIKVRQPFYSQLTQHSPQFGSGSTTNLLPATGNIDAVSIHKTNRNTRKEIRFDNSGNPVNTNKYDNFWVQHAIPASNFGYAWITASVISNPYTIGTGSLQFAFTSSMANTGEVNIDTQTLVGSLSASQQWYGTREQIRTGEHPVAQKQRETNIIAVQDQPIPTVQRNTNQNIAKRSGTSTNFKETPVTVRNHPINQELKFVGSLNTQPTTVRYTFKNNSSWFANEDLQDRLGIADKPVDFYEKLVTSKNSNNSVIEEIVSLTFKDTLYPREINTFLSGTRSRAAYITDQPGVDRDGYDRQLGTQRVFWRDNQEDRRRSANSDGGYINSLGYSSLEESGSNFTQNDNGILFDNSLINHSASLTQNFTNLDKGINNSIIPLESGSSERELYTYTGSFKGTFYNNGNTAEKVHADIVKRGYTPDIAGEFNNSFVDFYEQFVKDNQKQSIGSIYRNTSYKQMINSLPVSRENLPDVISRTDDESVFVNPKPRYVAFVGGGELNTGSVFDNSSNFTDQYFNTYISGANNIINKTLSVGNKVYFAGSFTQIGNIPIDYIAVYDKTSQKFSQLGTSYFNNSVLDIAISGTYIIAAGRFTTPAIRIAKYNILTGEWSGFGGGLGVGTIDAVRTILVSSSDIYVGGTFTTSGNYISKWNGTSWSALAGGLDNTVNTLLLSGSDIYAGGGFTATGSRVAKWDGTSWSAVGAGLSTNSVNTLLLSGSDIYAGGTFTTPSRVAKWDGASWSAVSGGLGSAVNKLILSGSDIYAGGIGLFAKWNGLTWSIISGITGNIQNFEIVENLLNVVGSFSIPYQRFVLYSTDTNSFSIFNTSPQYNKFTKNILNNSLNLSNIKFSTLDNGLINNKNKTPTYDDSKNYYRSDVYQLGKDYSILPEFKISEHLSDYINNGANFQTKNNEFLTLDGAGAKYKSADSKNSSFNKQSFLEKYSFTAPLNKEKIERDYGEELEQESISLNVSAFKKLLPYNGFYPQERTIQLANLYGDYIDNNLSGGIYNLNNINDYYSNRILSGNFYSSSVNYIEDSTNIDIEKFLNKYYLLNEEQESWKISGYQPFISSFVVSGSDLYIAGRFESVGNISCANIAKYNLINKTWSKISIYPANNSNANYFNCLALSGNYIYVGGFFDFNAYKGVAVYDILNDSWSSVGDGLAPSGAPLKEIRTILISGSDVYAGGSFTATGSRVAKWDGTSWSAVGDGLSNTVNTLLLSGSDIYAGGIWTTNTGSRVAKWDGTSWSAVGGGLSNTVNTLYISGNDIYAGGIWTTNTGSRVAKWDGATWTGLDTGLNNSVNVIFISGNDIYAGGNFNDAYSQHFAITDINYNVFNSYPNNKSYIYSSNNNTHKTFNQIPVLSLSSSYSNGRLISASNGLNLFSFKYNDYPSSTNKVLHNSISTDGLNWSESVSVVQPIHINDQFGEYFDYLYENNGLNEKILFAISSTTATTGSKTAAGVVSFVSATLKLASDDSGIKNWEYSNKLTLGTGSAGYNRFGTGLSILSCSSGYQVYMGEIYGDVTSVNYGNIWVTTSSNGNVWSEPISILSGTVPSSSLGFNNIKAVNFEKDGISRSYVFFTEPLSSGSSNVVGKFFVISSSINNNWGTTNINSQKTELYSVLPSTTISGTLFDVSGSNKYSIEAYSSNNFITYCLVNSAEDSEEQTEILIGNTYDGINWQTGEEMFRQVSSVAKGFDVVGLSTYEVSGNTLPVFFTNISSSAGANSIYAIHNNQYTQFTLNVSGTEKYVKQAALEPVMAPGILYNTIKSGIAVDWPCITGSQTSIQPYGSGTIVNAYYPQSFKMASHEGENINELNMYGNLRSNIDYRVDFEKLIFPDQIFPSKPTLTSSLTETTTLTSLSQDSELVQFISGCYVYGGYEPYTSPVDFSDYNQLGPKRFSVPFVYKKEDAEDNGLYSLAMSNFLAESVKFFLKNEALTTFASKNDALWGTFTSGTTYYMDIVMGKTADLVMMEAYHDSKHPVGRYGEKMNGRYFGYPVNKTNKQLWSEQSDDLFTDEEARLIHNDPAYAPYTPPYFEGPARLTLSFTPSASNTYKFDDIISNLKLNSIYTGLRSAHTASDAYVNKMSIESSVKIDGISFGTRTNTQGSTEQEPEQKRWTISTKFETPILDFSSQSLTPYENNYSKTSGYGRGMWSGYGEIPAANKGIYISLAESQQFRGANRNNSNVASLLQKVGFNPVAKKLGQIAETKTIKEAIMIIPFVERLNDSDIRKYNYNSKNRLTKLEVELGIEFIGVNNKTYEKVIKENIESSILDTVNKMKQFIVPPQLDYVKNSTIDPFVAYIAEFKHELSQQDLADIWQSVSPAIAKQAEFEEININHTNSELEFFHGKGIPKNDNIRFMMFKIKQKGEFDYFKVTADSSDDELNRKFTPKIPGEKPPEYGYNWPYDFFSLVELAKLDVEIKYKKKNN